MISALLLANKATSTGALSASLAHELSQPLAASMINVGILQRKFTQFEQVKDEDREILDAIIRDNRRASNIVLSLKKIFKQENIELEAMRILEVLERLKPIIYPQLRNKHVELISDIAFNPMIKLNVNEFHQVIVNIANNAIEAMEQANIKAEVNQEENPEMMNEGMRSWGHQFLYDRAELIDVLAEAGFSAVREVAWRESTIIWLREREQRPFHKEIIIEAARTSEHFL
jgi:signal transduction histidine kinase